MTTAVAPKTLAAALAVALGIGFGSAQAATINQLTIGNPLFSWEDDSIEKLQVDVNGNGLLDVGDTLRGIIEIPFFNNPIAATQFALNGVANNHLSAIFEVEVKAKIGAGPFDFIFGAVGAATGTVLTFYEDNVDNVTFLNCGATQAICEATVTDGTKILELGFTGDADEFWAALGVPSDDPDLGQLESQTVNFDFTDFNFGLGVIFSAIGQYHENQPSLNPMDNGLVQWAGGGGVGGTCTEPVTNDGNVICNQQIGSYAAGYTATDDANIGANRIPEPGTLGLAGLALIALGALRRRRQG